MKAMTVVAIAIGTRNHGINGKTLGVYLRSAESCHFRNIRRKKFTQSLAREPICCVCNIARLILDSPLVAARGLNAEIRDR
jgi:hypothetical protein